MTNLDYVKKMFSPDVAENAVMANLDQLRKTLPPVIARCQIDRYLGGLVARGSMQNLDSEGRGPRKIRMGKKVAYLREDLVSWLEERCSFEG